MPVVSEEGGENGWFCQPFVCRVPERIPLGLPAREPEGLKRKPEGQNEEEKPVLVHEHTARFDLEAVDGTVEVPLARLVRLYRLAWFCHNWALTEIRIDTPAGRNLELPVIEANAEGVQVSCSPGTLTVRFIPTGRQRGALRGLAAIAPQLKAIPDGCMLRLEAANLDPDELKKPRPLGLHRYEGTIKNDVLTMTRAYPVHDAAKLNAALALAAQVDNATFIDAATEDIAASVMKSLKTHPYFHDNPAAGRPGARLCPGE